MYRPSQRDSRLTAAKLSSSSEIISHAKYFGAATLAEFAWQKRQSDVYAEETPRPDPLHMAVASDGVFALLGSV
jgi:hypothetical protein